MKRLQQSIALMLCVLLLFGDAPLLEAKGGSSKSSKSSGSKSSKSSSSSKTKVFSGKESKSSKKANKVFLKSVGKQVKATAKATKKAAKAATKAAKKAGKAVSKVVRQVRNGAKEAGKAAKKLTQSLKQSARGSALVKGIEKGLSKAKEAAGAVAKRATAAIQVAAKKVAEKASAVNAAVRKGAEAVKAAASTVKAAVGTLIGPGLKSAVKGVVGGQTARRVEGWAKDAYKNHVAPTVAKLGQMLDKAKQVVNAAANKLKQVAQGAVQLAKDVLVDAALAHVYPYLYLSLPSEGRHILSHGSDQVRQIAQNIADGKNFHGRFAGPNNPPDDEYKAALGDRDAKIRLKLDPDQPYTPWVDRVDGAAFLHDLEYQEVNAGKKDFVPGGGTEKTKEADRKFIQRLRAIENDPSASPEEKASAHTIREYAEWVDGTRVTSQPATCSVQTAPKGPNLEKASKAVHMSARSLSSTHTGRLAGAVVGGGSAAMKDLVSRTTAQRRAGGEPLSKALRWTSGKLVKDAKKAMGRAHSAMRSGAARTLGVIRSGFGRKGASPTGSSAAKLGGLRQDPKQTRKALSYIEAVGGKPITQNWVNRANDSMQRVATQRLGTVALATARAPSPSQRQENERYVSIQLACPTEVRRGVSIELQWMAKIHDSLELDDDTGRYKPRSGTLRATLYLHQKYLGGLDGWSKVSTQTVEVSEQSPYKVYGSGWHVDTSPKWGGLIKLPSDARFKVDVEWIPDRGKRLKASAERSTNVVESGASASSQPRRDFSTTGSAARLSSKGTSPKHKSKTNVTGSRSQGRAPSPRSSTPGDKPLGRMGPVVGRGNKKARWYLPPGGPPKKDRWRFLPRPGPERPDVGKKRPSPRRPIKPPIRGVWPIIKPPIKPPIYKPSPPRPKKGPIEKPLPIRPPWFKRPPWFIEDPAPKPSDGERRVIDLATSDLSSRLGIPPDGIGLVSIERARWSNSALGFPLPPGQAAMMVLIDGYRIILTVGGQTYEYHTAGDRYVRGGDVNRPGEVGPGRGTEEGPNPR